MFRMIVITNTHQKMMPVTCIVIFAYTAFTLFKNCLLKNIVWLAKFVLQAATSSFDPKLVKNLNALMRHLHKDYIQLKMEASKRFTELHEFIKQVHCTLCGCTVGTGQLLRHHV